MNIHNVLPELTKSYLLERISQEEIAYYYTKIPVSEKTLIGNSFTSPFRNDNNPTCNYYYTDFGKLKLVDYATDFNGDVFDIVSYKTRISIKSSQGFVLLLHKIASDFRIHKYTNSAERDKLHINITAYTKERTLKIIKVIPRKFNRFDEMYWTKQYGITQEYLRAAIVIPVDELWVSGYDGELYRRYRYNAKNPAYAYYGGKENGINIWKIYFPLSPDRKKKFLSNKSFMQGTHLLKPAEVCVITKSYKDVLCFKSFGLQSVALASESQLPTKVQILPILSLFNICVSVMDYDKAGILMANKLKKEYNIPPLMFTKGRFNQPNYGVKDFSDFISFFGREKAQELLNITLNKYREQLDEINIYHYKSLLWLKQ